MPLFKSNRDFDSTIIVLGIHILLAGLITVSALDIVKTDMSSIMNNLLIVYGMICSYFFKSQQNQNQNQSQNGAGEDQK